jgi:hypothetical protein
VVTGPSNCAAYGCIRRPVSGDTVVVSFTVLFSTDGKLATKQHSCDESGTTTTLDYDRGYQWLAKVMEVSNFCEMVGLLVALLDEPRALVIRSKPKPGLDVSKAVFRRKRGPGAAFDDVPQQWLHLDIDGVAAEHLDVIADPQGAIDYALDLIATHAPELKGISAFCSFSPSAGVYDVTNAKLHVWFWLVRPYSNAELRRWGAQVNARARYKLIDLAVFEAVQPNYTARPLFVGGTDPFAGARRWAVVHGHADVAELVIDAEEPPVRRTKAAVGRTYGGGGFERHLADIGGERGIYEPARAAIAARIGSLGAERATNERDAILERVLTAVRDAPRGDRSEAKVELHCNDLTRFFDWAMTRQLEGEAARPPEPVRSTRLPLAEARQLLHAKIHDAIAALVPIR